MQISYELGIAVLRWYRLTSVVEHEQAIRHRADLSKRVDWFKYHAPASPSPSKVNSGRNY